MASKKKAPAKKAVPKTPVMDVCNTCDGERALNTMCACGGVFCKHAIIGHQMRCVQYKVTHARLRRNALARKLAEPIRFERVENDLGVIKQRLDLLTEAMILLLEASSRK